MSGVKCLLSISVLKITGEELEKFRQEHKYYNEKLPKYCVKEGTPTHISDWAENYLQFVNKGTYHLFDIESCDEPLQEEISNSDFSYLIRENKININFIEKLPHIMDYNQWVNRFTLLPKNHILFNLNYIGSGGCDYEYDYILELSIDGYFDNEFNLVINKTKDILCQK